MSTAGSKHPQCCSLNFSDSALRLQIEINFHYKLLEYHMLPTCGECETVYKRTEYSAQNIKPHKKEMEGVHFIDLLIRKWRMTIFLLIYCVV